jgi:ABC-type glycerol-3-phosphate transport system substrate-binding protein
MTLQPSAFAVTLQDDPVKKAWIAAFLDSLLTPEVLAQYQIAGSAVPVVPDPPPATGPYAEVLDRQAQWVAALGLNDLGVAAHNFSNLVTSFYPEIQAAFLGQKTAQQALDDYTAQGNEFLHAP